MIPNDIIFKIVEAGTWAPSADNCQPWNFIWDGNILYLLKDPERTGFFYDVNHESVYITFGAVIENIRIAATHYGLKADINLFPSIENHNLIAEIKFKQAKINEDPLYPFVLQRHVNRKPYFKKKIEPDIVQKLKNVVSETPGADMIWIDGKDDKRVMRNVIYNADRILFEDKRLHEGLFRWLRIKKEESSKKDGMNLDVLELSWFQKQVFPILSNWKILSWLNKIGMSRVPGINSIILLKQSPAYCLLTMNNRSPSDYINGGRMMERFWIKANALGLSIQPMAGFIFLLNHLHYDGALQFKKNHKIIIQKMQTALQMLFPGQEKRTPIMFFRLGYAEPPETRTPRRPVNEIFII